ncbi:hypothetical protein FQA39_LY17915 [Lamprigera yunnana]|nr:hypothetical protein FQA39_LY17915 [Lamprigera yunnana]
MQNRSRIDLGKKLLFTIWTLAKPESFLAVGEWFGLAKSTAHGIFKDVIGVISGLMPQYVRFPTPEEYELIAHLKNLDVASVEYANQIIAAACVLHNFLTIENVIVPDLNEVGNDMINDEGPLGEAAAKRMAIARNL